MVAGRYTLLEQPAAAELLPATLEFGVDVIAVGVFNSGVLATSSPSAGDSYEYGAMPPEVLARAVLLAECCREHGVELPHAAIQFAMAHPAVVNVTVGAASPDHLRQAAAWASTPVPDSLWAHVAEHGLITLGDSIAGSSPDPTTPERTPWL
jgi:D-threo-aldose 1-dehydrogenase